VYDTEYEVDGGLTKCPGVGDLESLRAAAPGMSRRGHFICRYCREQKRKSQSLTHLKGGLRHCITKNTPINPNGYNDFKKFPPSTGGLKRFLYCIKGINQDILFATGKN